MSRGHGKIETAILEVLTQNSEEMFLSLELAVIVYEVAPDEAGYFPVSPAQAAAVRRALSNLQRQGKAFNLGRFHGGPHGFSKTKWACADKARSYTNSLARAFGETDVPENLAVLLPED